MDFMFGYGSADASTSVLVGAFPERARDIDESQFVYEVGAHLGLKHERGDFSIGVEIGASYGNTYPVVEYQEADPAKLEFESEARTDLGLSIGFRF
jgi:hypothetical protein